MKPYLGPPILATALLLLAGHASADLPSPDEFQGTTLNTALWSTKEVGSDAQDSAVTVNDGRLRLFGAGQDIFDDSYAFLYVYQRNITGDFSLRLKVDSLPDLSQSSGAGLLIAQTDGTAAEAAKLPAYFLIQGTHQNGIEMKGGGSGRTRSDRILAGTQPPYWLRLDRVGQQVLGYVSQDDERSWTLVREDTFHSGGPLEGGLEIGSEPPLQEPFVVGIHEQTHAGSTSAESVVEHFQVVPLDTGTISGSVFVSGSRSVAKGAWVAARGTNGLFWTQTGDDGAYTFKVPAGDYTLTTDTAALNGDSSPVSVPKGAIVRGSLRVSAVPFMEPSTANPYDDSFAGTTLDPKWTSADIGTGTAGSQTVKDGQVTVAGAGTGVGQFEAGTPQSHFHYLYQRRPIEGDFALTVRETSAVSMNPAGRSGLFLRNDTDPGSAEALVALTGDGGAAFRWRRAATASGDTDEWDLPGVKAPGFLKLRHRGPFVAAWYSADGTVAKLLGQAVVPGLSPRFTAGLGVTSGTEDATDAASFTDFRYAPLAAPSTSTSHVAGDANGDGSFTVQDLVATLQAMVGLLALPSQQQTAADVNGDARITPADVVLMLKRLVGLISSFPVQAPSGGGKVR